MYKYFFSKNKIGIFIISRYYSKRLKNKASLKVLNKNLIEILIERLSKYFSKKDIIICTSKKNNNIKFYSSLAKKNKLGIFFGYEKNVIGRIIKCINQRKYNHFVRITGDNPLTDSDLIYQISKRHLIHNNDYTYSTSLPHGMRAEIFSKKALIRFYDYIQDLNSTEYLTYFFLRPDLYKIENVKIKQKFLNQHKHSISIDTKKDFIFFKKLIIYYQDILVKRNDILRFLNNKKKKTFKEKKIIYLKTKKYNALYKFDDEKKKIICD